MELVLELFTTVIEWIRSKAVLAASSGSMVAVSQSRDDNNKRKAHSMT